MSFEQWLRDWALVIGGFGALLAAIAAWPTMSYLDNSTLLKDVAE
jgi:hypothetical protein